MEQPSHTDRALEILRHTFGYEAFRGHQADIINTVCEARDSLVLMPTGGGKSMCYQIPALLSDGTGVVVSPLIALMQDQVSALQASGVDAAFLNSSQSTQEQAQVIERLRSGYLDLLYVAPERLLQESTLEMLDQSNINLFAIDEAHCVSAWGHDFRQDYLGLGVLGERYQGVPRIALTATADERTRQDILERLALQNPAVFVQSFDRPNICYSVQIKRDAKQQLLSFLAEHRSESGIVYCLSRRSVESTSQFLNSSGYRALPYHAGMQSEDRAFNQSRFLQEEGLIMVATIAFGMGIDKPDVRFVAHMDLPKSIEAYYQETGRAGRDGAAADAWMVYGLQDVVRLSRMIEESEADHNHKRIERAKLDTLLGWSEVTACRRIALLAHFGEPMKEACGNCDICLTPPVTWDGTREAQMALSAVYRTGQRFGASHVIDVLRGADNEKVRRFNHQILSTFGIGQELSDQRWRSVFRQLVVRGYLNVDHNNFGGLRLTEASRSILKGEEVLWLREEAQTRQRARRQTIDYELALEDEDLMDDLKELRRRLAEEASVPPYVIFHDRTLLDMIRLRPDTLAQMRDVNGVGEAKLSRYGELFLDVLQAHGRIRSGAFE
ncbi:MAG: DNA helicase RecQ [Pseudomonadota bacterium]